jgi:predicted transposase YbfD/YdcC
VEAEEVERVIGQFFARTSKTVAPQRGSIQLAIDGKTLRGTIPLGETEGAHLLAVYQPEEGVVLAQMNVKKKGRELTFAPTLLRQIDLRGVVVSGDAMFDRRSLSRMIVQAGGDYLWTVKENEKELYADIVLLFQPPRKLAGTSAPPMDFREATTIEKGHGRTDKRSILVSSLLAEYKRDWLNLAQVYKLERQSTNALGITKTQIRYGVTSLPELGTNPQRLLQLTRGHWGIENGLHYRRDVTFHEDRGQIRMGHAPEMLAVLNHIALGLFARPGETNMAHARREFAYVLDASLARLVV